MNPIKDILNDNSLREVSKAYHELEAFQLSDEHLKTKKLLIERLKKSSDSEENEGPPRER